MSKTDHSDTIALAMGFDFGLHKIGIATGQLITKSATPLTIITAQGGKPNWEQLDPIMEQWKPDALVVGRPLNMDDSESELSRLSEKFARRLYGRYDINPKMMDERLSTREAQELAKEQGLKGPVDALAAAIILQDWMYGNPNDHH